MPISFTRETLKQIRSIEDLNELLFDVGANLVADKKTLVLWIRGLQDFFADFYILNKKLKQSCSELQVLKSFLVVMIENLKTKVNDLLNEKEDMFAMH